MVARDGDSVVFSNPRQPDGPVYVCTVDEWKEFIIGVKAGDFDNLT
jgi:hypothetical protein